MRNLGKDKGEESKRHLERAAAAEKELEILKNGEFDKLGCFIVVL